MIDTTKANKAINRNIIHLLTISMTICHLIAIRDLEARMMTREAIIIQIGILIEIGVVLPSAIESTTSATATIKDDHHIIDTIKLLINIKVERPRKKNLQVNLKIGQETRKKLRWLRIRIKCCQIRIIIQKWPADIFCAPLFEGYVVPRTR